MEVECDFYTKNFKKRKVIENATTKDFYFLIEYISGASFFISKSVKKTII